MSSQTCANCLNNHHHYTLKVENCECFCENMVPPGDHTSGTPFDISNTKPSNIE